MRVIIAAVTSLLVPSSLRVASALFLPTVVSRITLDPNRDSNCSSLALEPPPAASYSQRTEAHCAMLTSACTSSFWIFSKAQSTAGEL